MFELTLCSVLAIPSARYYIKGTCANKKHRQPDVVCLIDGAKIGPFHGVILIPHLYPMIHLKQKHSTRMQNAF